MKSIEEKAKAYDEAIGKLREFYRDYDTVSLLIDVKEELANILPEIKESEDECIRRCIAMCLTDADEQRFKDYNTTVKDCLAWLEKQGEQKLAEWGEEDERMFNSLVWHLRDSVNNGEKRHSAGQLEDWLESLKQRYTWRPSEEQIRTLEYYMHSLICTKHKEVLFGLYNDLKKLKGE